MRKDTNNEGDSEMHDKQDREIIPPLLEIEKKLEDAEEEADHKTTSELYLTVEECINRYRETPESLWWHILPTNISILFGPPDEGKSFLALGLAVAIAEGKKKYLGWDIKAKYNRAILVSYEDSAGDLGWRFEKMGIENLENIYLVTMDICKPKKVFRNISKIIKEVGGVDLINLDPLRLFYGGKSSLQDDAVSKLMEDVQSLIPKWKAAVLAIGHSTKKDGKKWTPESLKGVVEQMASARLIIKLTDSYLGIVKGNAVPNEEKEKAHELEWDREEFVWKRTGEWEYQSTLEKSKKVDKRKVNVDWDKVLGDENEMKLQDLITKLKEMYDLSERGANTYITEDLERVKHGVYKRKT